MIWIALALVLCCCLLLALGIALMRAAQRADEEDIEALRALALEAVLNELAHVRSASGRRFFESPDSRHQLELALAELFDIDPDADLVHSELPGPRRRFARRRARRRLAMAKRAAMRNG